MPPTSDRRPRDPISGHARCATPPSVVGLYAAEEDPELLDVEPLLGLVDAAEPEGFAAGELGMELLPLLDARESVR